MWWEYFSIKFVRCSLVYLCLATTYLLAFGVMLIYYGLALDSTADPNVDFVRQIQRDWQQVPYVDITVTDEWVCPDGQAEIFSRVWYGTTAGCDCLNKCTDSSSGLTQPWCYKMLQNVVCNTNQLNVGCTTVDAYNAVYQNQFHGVRVCGTPGGEPFLNVTRPDATDEQCPSGTTPCIDTTIANETICYPPDEHDSKCPITDIRIVKKTIDHHFKTEGYTILNFNRTTSLVYSKQVAQLPPTTITVEAMPCMYPYQQSKGNLQTFYSLEIQQSGCTQEVNSGLKYDPRFQPSGLFSTVGQIQTQNEVQNILKDLPDYSSGETKTDNLSIVESWNRPTLNWSLSCENDGKGREFAFQESYGTIESSPKMVQIHKIGISMCFFYAILSIATWIALCLCICSKKEEYVGKVFEGNYQIVGVLTRLTYLIMGPLLGLALFDSIEAVKSGKNTILGYDYVVNCMDQYTILNTNSAYQNMVHQQDTLHKILIMWYVSMAFIVFEVIAGITIAIYFSTRKCRAARKDENKMTERLSIVREDELAEAKAMTDVHDIDE